MSKHEDQAYKLMKRASGYIDRESSVNPAMALVQQDQSAFLRLYEGLSEGRQANLFSHVELLVRMNEYAKEGKIALKPKDMEDLDSPDPEDYDCVLIVGDNQHGNAIRFMPTLGHARKLLFPPMKVFLDENEGVYIESICRNHLVKRWRRGGGGHASEVWIYERECYLSPEGLEIFFNRGKSALDYVRLLEDDLQKLFIPNSESPVALEIQTLLFSSTVSLEEALRK